MARLLVGERLDRRLDLESGDRLVLVLMGGQIAILLAAYTIAKVLRDSMFLTAYGANALPWGYVAVAAVAIGLIALESRLARRLPSNRVSGLTQSAAIALSAAAALISPSHPSWLPAAFYVWTGSLTLLLVSHFWIVALDAWDSQRARRIFPLLTGSGLLGGVAGGVFAGVFAGRRGETFLLWVLCGLLLAFRVLTLMLSVRLPQRPLVTQVAAGTSQWAAFRGSTFLRYLAAVLGLAVVVSTLVDFQFKALAQQAYPDAAGLARFLGGFYAGLNVLALVVQFGVAGWLLRRLGIGAASSLQPASMFVIGAGLFIAPLWPVAQAMRWVQGIVSQTLGKSSSEIYFMAIRPPERRQVKPLIDVVVERGADAVAGILLLVTFQLLGVSVRVVAALTVVAALLWIAMLYQLHRRYVRAFRELLAAPWAEPDSALESLRVPGAIEALAEAIKSDDPRRVAIALRFAARAGRASLAPAVRGALGHESPRVRTEAVRGAIALGLSGEDERMRSFLADPYEPLQRAALESLLTHGHDAPGFAREVIEGGDRVRREHALDLMELKPALAYGSITLDWIDRRIAAGTPEELRDACRGLGHVPGPEAQERLRQLLPHADRDVRRAALRALARRPAPEFLDVALDHLDDQGLRSAAQDAVVAFGERAVPRLAALAREHPEDEVRSHATAALSRIGGRNAHRVLIELAKSSDAGLRYHGLRNLNRIHERTGRRQISRRDALRMFLREIRDDRIHSDLALALPATADGAVALLRASHLESADRALARACRALACYHWPPPLRGAYEGLRTGSSRESAARALEYLGSLLPGRSFQVARGILEVAPAPLPGAPTEHVELQPLLEKALQSDDPWIQAVAARAAATAPDVAAPAASGEDERPRMNDVERVLYLRGIDVFKQAGPRQLLALAAYVREVPMWKGQVIYQETDPADGLYVVVDGRVRLATGDQVLAEIGSGEAFGTWALVDDTARGQRAESLEDGLLITLGREEFYDFASGHTQLLKDLVRVLAGRLKELVVERPEEARVEGEGVAAAEATKEDEVPEEEVPAGEAPPDATAAPATKLEDELAPKPDAVEP